MSIAFEGCDDAPKVELETLQDGSVPTCSNQNNLKSLSMFKKAMKRDDTLFFKSSYFLSTFMHWRQTKA